MRTVATLKRAGPYSIWSGMNGAEHNKSQKEPRNDDDDEEEEGRRGRLCPAASRPVGFRMSPSQEHDAESQKAENLRSFVIS